MIPKLNFIYDVWVSTSFVAGIGWAQKAANSILRRHGLGELIPFLPFNAFKWSPEKILGVTDFKGLAVGNIYIYIFRKGSFMNKLRNYLLNKFEKEHWKPQKNSHL